jgi:hypothetical protein
MTIDNPVPKLLVTLVIDKTGDAHVRPRDTALVPGFQYFSHVLELTAFVTSLNRSGMPRPGY